LSTALAPAVPVVLNRLVVLAAFGLVLACVAEKTSAVGSAALTGLGLVALSRVVSGPVKESAPVAGHHAAVPFALRRGLDLTSLGLAVLLLAGTFGYDPRGARRRGRTGLLDPLGRPGVPIRQLPPGFAR